MFSPSLLSMHPSFFSSSCLSLFWGFAFLMYLLFSRLVVSSSLWPHGLQHARLLCPSLSPRAHSKACSLSRWCHPTISSSVIPFSSCLQSFPTSRSFPMSQLFASGGQSIGASTSALALPMNTQGWFPLELINWFDLHAVQGTLKSFFQHHSSKASILYPCKVGIIIFFL